MIKCYYTYYICLSVYIEELGMEGEKGLTETRLGRESVGSQVKEGGIEGRN